MSQIKQRDYMFDAFRGLLIWSIPLSHFTRVAGSFSQASLSGIIYITINVFVMQAFVFLSGYFSKKPDRARETAFQTFLWPLWFFTPFFYFVRHFFYGNANFYWDLPPFALWYLFALFFYRFLLKDYIKIPHIFTISMLVYLFAGQVSWLSDTWALGRMVSYFPFFLLGYYCDKDTLTKLRALKKRTCIILAILLVGASVFLAFFVDQLSVGFYLLKSPAAEINVLWYYDIIGRAIIFVLACMWIILMINIIPNKNSYLVYVGVNTMPIYIFHLIIRYWVKQESIFLGIFPENQMLYYVLIFAYACICVFVLSSKPISKMYDFVVDGSYKIFIYIVNKVVLMLGVIEKMFIVLLRKIIRNK